MLSCQIASLWPAPTSGSTCYPNTSNSQIIRRSATTWSAGDTEMGNTLVDGEGRNCTLLDNDDQSDSDFPTVEQVLQGRPYLGSNRELPHLKLPTLNQAETHSNQTQLELGNRPGASLERPVVLDDDEPHKADTTGEAGDASSGVVHQEDKHEASAPDSLSACQEKGDVEMSSLGDDVAVNCPVDGEHAPEFGSVSYLVQPISTGPAPHSLSSALVNVDNGQRDTGMAELEKDILLAFEEPAVPSRASASNSPGHLVEASQSTANRDRSGSVARKPDYEEDACQHIVPARGLDLEQRIPVGVEGAVEVLQQEEPAQKEALGQLTVGGGENVDADAPRDNEGNFASLVAQTKAPDIDEQQFRLRGMRRRPRAGCQSRQFRIVWGEPPDREDEWVNEEDLQFSSLQLPCQRPPPLQLPCQRSPQDSGIQVTHSIRVHDIRRSSTSKTVFEYQVSRSSKRRAWINENQVRISLSPSRAAKNQEPSTYLSSQAQSKVALEHTVMPVNDKHDRYMQKATRDTSPPVDPTSEPEHVTRKRTHQDIHIASDTENIHSPNADDNQNTCDSSDEDPRPPRRRKRHAVPAETSSAPLQPPCLGSPSIRLETAESQAEDGHGRSSFINDQQHRDSRTSRSPSTLPESGPSAEYQEWQFQGIFKRTKIGADMTYHLEFKLPPLAENGGLPIHPQAIDFCPSIQTPAMKPSHRDAVAHSKMHIASERQTKRIRWTAAEDAKLCKMRKDNCSCDEIDTALPSRSKESIQVRFSTKFKK